MRRPYTLAHTCSIVALDKATGRLGVAVHGHDFCVGAVVPWVESGVGAVATQAEVDMSYGALSLASMRDKKNASQALEALLAGDERRERRQVAMVDATGKVAVHTGKECIPEAGHRTGDGYSVQVNLALSKGVPDAMAKAYKEAKGDLLERLIVALEAGHEAGSDIRGQQSAAVIIAPGPGESQSDRAPMVVDLRVDDHLRPLLALRRLATIHRGYRWIDEAIEALQAGDLIRAEHAYGKMWGLAVGSREPMFWYAVALVNEGQVERALPIFGEVFTHDPVWLDVLDRLVPAGYLPDDAGLLKRIKSVVKKSAE